MLAETQRRLLRGEGVKFVRDAVDMAKFHYLP
jgi:hypothetical protein